MANVIPLFSRRRHLGAALETDWGTPATVSAVNSNTVIYNPRCVLTAPFANGQRKPIGPYLGNLDAYRGKLIAEFSFTQELRHSDALSVLLQAAGHKVTTGSVHKPTSSLTDRKTATLAFWESGRRKGVAGAVLNGRLYFDVGERVYIDWTGQGVPILDGSGKWVIAEALPADPTRTGQCYFARSGTLTMAGSFSPVFSRFEMDFGNELEMREDVTNATGFKHAMVGDRNLSLRLDPEAALPADHDAWGLMLAGTEFALSCTASDGSNTLTIAAPKAQRLNINDESRGSRHVDAIECQANKSSGDDEWSITCP